LPLVYWLAHRRIGFSWSRPVFLLSIVTFATCIGSAILALTMKWGMSFGCVTAVGFALFSLGRITQLTNLGGPAGQLGASVRRLTERIGGKYA
jgi:hypothetical protein